MPLESDLPSAARRVAADIREGSRPAPDDLLALLPVLVAVAAGQDDEARVERWARSLCAANGIDSDALLCDDDTPEWHFYRDDARAVIALADAERAAGVALFDTDTVAELERCDDEQASALSCSSWLGTDDISYRPI